MKIRYLGHSCFELTSKKGVTVLTDPYTGVGYELPKGLTADIVTTSHGHFDHSFLQGVQAKTVLASAGTHTVEGILFEGIESYHDEKAGTLRGKNVLYKIRVDGLTVCHMGDIGEACSPYLLEKIGRVDVLLIPVGGTYTVDAKGAKEYIDKIQPKIVLPMHYKPTDGSLDITGIQPFLDRCGEYTAVKEGVMYIDEGTQGIFYMERVK